MIPLQTPRMALLNNRRWQGCGETGTLRCCWWGCETVQQLCQTVWQSLKKVNRVTMWPRNSTPRYLPKKVENIFSHKNLYRNVHSNIFYDSKRPTTAHMPISWWMCKQNASHAVACSTALKRNGALTQAIAQTNLDNFMLSEGSQTTLLQKKNKVLYDSIYMRCPE